MGVLYHDNEGQGTVLHARQHVPYAIQRLLAKRATFNQEGTAARAALQELPPHNLVHSLASLCCAGEATDGTSNTLGCVSDHDVDDHG